MIGNNNKKDKEPEKGVDPDAWMVTFSDLLTLMLTFFVMLLTMSTIDSMEIKGAFGIFNSPLEGDLGLKHMRKEEGYGLLDVAGGIGPIGEDKGGFMPLPFRYVPLSKTRSDAEELEALFAKLARNAKTKITKFTEEEADELGHISMKFQRKGISIHLPNQLIFKQGKADINPNSKIVLRLMGNWVKGKSYNLKIEGHTDDTKIKTLEFSSNWELSVTRAVNVMRFFRENKFISPARSNAYGYSEFQSLVLNDSIENRKKNNRIEVVFKRPRV